jgi:hypothetical protein
MADSIGGREVDAVHTAVSARMRPPANVSAVFCVCIIAKTFAFVAQEKIHVVSLVGFCESPGSMISILILQTIGITK